MSTARPLRIAILFVVAAAVRLAFSLLWHPPGEFLSSDMGVYDQRAQHLLSGELGPWDTFTPVGYPALLAAIYAIAGRSFWVVAVVQALLGGASAVATERLAARLGSPALALTAGLCVALHPALIFYSGFVLSETLASFLLLATLWLFVRAAEKSALRGFALAGLVLGIASVVRPNLLALFALLLPWLWVVSGRSARRTIARAAITAACLALPVAAASLHNTRIVGRLAGPATNGGLNFYLNLAEVRSVRFVEGSKIHHIQPVPNAIRYDRDEWVEQPFYEDGYWFRRGLALAGERPLRVLRAGANLVEGSGAGRQRYWPYFEPLRLPLAGFSVFFFAVAVVPTLLSIGWLGIRRRLFEREHSTRLLLAVAIASLVATIWLFLGDPRVRVPFDPVFVLLAVDAGWRLAAHLHGRFASHRSVEH